MTWWQIIVIIVYLSWLSYGIFRSIKFQMAGEDEAVIENNLKIAAVNIGLAVVSYIIVVVLKLSG